MNSTFHISLPCNDIKVTKNFYKYVIGEAIGRFSDNWLDVNLFGHQLTFTNAGKFNFNNPNYVFEGKILPSFHFGIILDKKKWQEVYSRLKTQKLELVEKATFLKGQSGEHTSFYVKDPNEYMLEFKSFRDPEEIFK